MCRQATRPWITEQAVYQCTRADPSVAIYSKVSLQASNDRINRIRRGVVIGAVSTAQDPTHALTSLELL